MTEFPGAVWLAAFATLPGATVDLRPDRMTVVDGIALTDRSLVDPRSVGDDFDLTAPEGQFAILTATRDSIATGTDTIGCHPLFECRIGDAWLVANAIRPLALLVGDHGIDVASSAFYVATGMPGSGTLTPRVSRLAAGEAVTVWASCRRHARSRRPVQAADRWGTRELGDRLTSQLSSIANVYGPLDLALSGGADSRVVLAVALASGTDVRVFTTGDGVDTDIAREVTARAGCAHEVWPVDRVATRRNWDRLAADTVWRWDGLESLWAAAKAQQKQPRMDANVTLDGLGGESAKGIGVTPRTLLTGRWRDPGQVIRDGLDLDGLLTADGRQSAQATVTLLVEQMLDEGWPRNEVPELWKGLVMGPKHSPKWRRVFPAVSYSPWKTRTMLAATLATRRIERPGWPLHRGLIEELRPELGLEAPMTGRWPLRGPGTALIQAPILRRLDRRRPPPVRENTSVINDEIVLAELERCLDRTESELWNVVDRPQIEAAAVELARGAMRSKPVRLIRVPTLFRYEELLAGSRNGVPPEP